MVQLTDDCFAFGERLTPVDDALAQLRNALMSVVDTETVLLKAALSRILAEDIIASENVPFDNNSAVDGFSVYYDDINSSSETRLPISGRAIAGVPLAGIQNRGEAVHIFTGALMPNGKGSLRPDTVIMQEDCLIENGELRLPAGIQRGANRRLSGEDIQFGQCILEKGCRLRPQEIGLAASIGKSKLLVNVPLKVAIFSTGNEVLEPGVPRFPGGVYDSNRFVLMNLLIGVGCQVDDLGILPDDPEIIKKALLAAADTHDLIVTSGGVSVGAEDHVRAVVEKEGSIYFWRLAVKPGRPVALGQINGKAFIGLPGNPVAVMVTFLRIARPVILQLSGATHVLPKVFPVLSSFSYKKKLNRREYVRVRVETDGQGSLIAKKYESDGAGILSSMVFADGLVELSETSMSVKAGDTVNYIPFSELGL
jgi:molybdopterin molybdotransferase